jgi:hypothetical protein
MSCAKHALRAMAPNADSRKEVREPGGTVWRSQAVIVSYNGLSLRARPSQPNSTYLSARGISAAPTVFLRVASGLFPSRAREEAVFWNPQIKA